MTLLKRTYVTAMLWPSDICGPARIYACSNNLGPRCIFRPNFELVINLNGTRSRRRGDRQWRLVRCI
jgi:hypothetical protein